MVVAEKFVQSANRKLTQKRIPYQHKMVLVTVILQTILFPGAGERECLLIC